MATPKELREVEEAHRAAQATLGLAGAYLVYRDWGAGAGAQAVSETASGWISPALRVINAIRKKSRRLARRYYQLARAIETGSTLGLPDSFRQGGSVNMAVLREEYANVLNEIAGLGTAPAAAEDPDERFFEEELVKASPENDADENNRAVLLDAVDLESYIDEWIESREIPDDTSVDVDDFEWADDEDFEEIRELLAEAIRKDVIEIGDRRIKDIRDSDVDPDVALDQVQEQHNSSGSAAAGRVDRYGIQSGRDELDSVIRRDRKVKLVARGLGPNPCAFCAMLASRGFVFKNKMSAMTSGGNNNITRYHDNCHCYPIVRWVDASDLPEANSWLQEQWPIVTSGLSGIDARREWRRWFNREGRELLRQQLVQAANQTIDAA